MNARKPAKGPLLARTYQGLQSARQHIDWTNEDWYHGTVTAFGGICTEARTEIHNADKDTINAVRYI